MHYTVYKITNKLNNKIYIGAHKTDNLDDGYMGSGVLIRRSIEKYGIENFTKDILFDFDNEESMFAMENELVTEEFISRPDVYNLKPGGTGSFYFINHNGLNNSANQHLICGQRRKEDPEYAAAMNEKISAGLKYYFSNHEPWWVGKTHKEESKKKIGQANSKHQTGNGNSHFGHVWIYNETLKENKSIEKSLLETYLSQGWTKGRKIKFE